MSNKLLRELSDKLTQLESQSLENTDEYFDVFEQYESVSMRVIHDLNCEGVQYVLSVFCDDDIEGTQYGTYNSWEEASEVGDELIENNTIDDYEIITSDELEL